MTAIAITRTDMTAVELRAAAGREKDGCAARRMLALAMVFEGVDRASAATSCGMDRQILRDWVLRYNEQGLAGLRNRKASWRPPRLTPEQQAAFKALVEKGPDPVLHKVVRWRRRDLSEELERLFGVKLQERSVGDLLAKLGYRRLSVRPQHPKSDEAAQEAFKKTSPRRSRKSSPSAPKASRSKSGSRTKPALGNKAH